jgi:hypothetical protein
MPSLELAQPLTPLSANTAIMTSTLSSLLVFLLSVWQVEELHILAYLKTTTKKSWFSFFVLLHCQIESKKIYFSSLCI